ncbi:MAG: energy-coupling factor transporter transmembrane component T [Tissierellia bacterium]|nr:energy-coupling factor transporter transmembrane component T [Tissierellia bacterium]
MEIIFMENFSQVKLKKAICKVNKVDKKNVRINPKTIFGLILIFSIVVLVGSNNLYYASLIISLLCVASTSIKSALKFLIGLIIMYFFSKGLEYIYGGILVGSIYSMLKIGLRLSPIFILARIISFYSTSYLISVLRSMGIKGNLNIAIALLFRLLPEIKIRLSEIRDGLKIRGFRISFFHPIKAFELYFVPLLYKCLHISDTLTCSILTKGIEYNGEKSNFHKIKLNIFDYILWLLGIVLLGGSIWKIF